jgi:hypothetical protein
MLHIATAHVSTPRWIDIQASHLRAHLSMPYTTWGSIAQIDPAYGGRFDRVIEQKGPEAGKLNHLALEIEQEADPADLLLFLAPDAFPIADPGPLFGEGLRRAPLLAARRTPGPDFPQPSPCFCLTTVASWASVAGDWSDGHCWHDARGMARTGPGANLLRRLEVTGTPWAAAERSNPPRGAPGAFAVYERTIYHHGVAGIEAAGVDRRTINRLRRESDRVLALLEQGGESWLERVT